MSDNPIWERLETDTDKSYEAFCIYRDMGATRSLREVVRILDKTLTQIGRWSSAHNWVNRVSAYDDYQREERRKRNIERQKEIEDNAFSDYVVLREAIHKYSEDYRAVGFRGVTPHDLNGLVALMTKADDYARRAVGLPDRITESKNELTGADGGAINVQSTNINMEAHSVEDANAILRELEMLGIIPNGTTDAINESENE